MATCSVTFSVKDVSDTAYEGAVIRARYATPQGAASDTVLASDRWVTATTDVNGDATLTLQQGAVCRITCIEAGLDMEFEVPEQATYVFAKELT